MSVTLTKVPERTVLCQDAIQWLDSGPVLQRASFITSLPDVSELSGLGLDGWRAWFISAAVRVMRAVPEGGVAIFFQTDIRKNGAWIDKGYLCQRAAEEAEMTLLWRKVVCRIPAGNPVTGRPGFSHLLCFANTPLEKPGPGLPDVLPNAGAVTWTRGMGVRACQVACRFVQEAVGSEWVVDPFCGHGTVLAVANALGLNALGVEKSPKRARRAERLELLPSGELRG